MSINRALGKGATKTLSGVEYKFSALTQDVQGDYEEWLWQRIKAQANGDLELKINLNERKASGEYDFFSQVSMRSIGSVAGVLQLTWLLLHHHHPKLSVKDVEQLILDNQEEVTEVIKEALDVGDIKNPQTPAT